MRKEAREEGACANVNEVNKVTTGGRKLKCHQNLLDWNRSHRVLKYGNR